ncbi:MAG: penicillin-binding protein 2 [Acidimicrobiia bacterium]
MSETRVRSSIVGVVVLALFSALFARLWYLQVAATDQFSAAAVSNSVREIVDPPLRGRILDAQGRVLVDNQVENQITVSRKLDPKQLRQVIAHLSVLLDKPAATLNANLSDPRNSPFTAFKVADGVDEAALVYIAEHRSEFPGVRAEAAPVRRYVNGSVAFHELGYLGEINAAELKAQVDPNQYRLGDEIGKSGVELTYESDLRGRPGVTKIEVDSSGRVLRRTGTKASQPGHDVRLTLDLDVQKTAESALQQGIDSARTAQDIAYKKNGYRKLNAPAGAVVVLDAATGSVVALASKPDFNANQFVHGIPMTTWNWLAAKENNLPLVDRAVSGAYAPGSTFKLVTSVAGLNSGIITPTKTINDPGEYRYPTDPQHPFVGEGANGHVALARALTVSSDAFFYSIGGDLFFRYHHQQPFGDELQKVAREFGFGSQTGIALPTESVGRVPDAAWKTKIHDANPKAFPYPDWLPGDNIQSAVGQGDVLVTPIQMASAYATLANGGTRLQPRVADAVLDAHGKVLRAVAPITLSTVAIPGRDTILAGLRGVVADPKGTAAAAFAGFPSGLAAGKTGTAQAAPKQNTSWFVGMTPADNPKYIVLAMVEEGGYGAQTAAPIARAVIEQLNQLPVGPVVNIAPPRGN